MARPSHDTAWHASRDRAEQRARFWKKVIRGGSDDCWHWRGTKINSGYGLFSLRNAATLAHRYSYFMHYGELPAGPAFWHGVILALCFSTPAWGVLAAVIWWAV